MSGLFKSPKTKVVVSGAAPGLVDPTVDLTQPGGPFVYGEGILTDGGGGFTIAPTLRPYFVSFRIPSRVRSRGTVACEHQGVDTSIAGFVTTLSVNLIAISVSLDAEVPVGHSYIVEIMKKSSGKARVLASLKLEPSDERQVFRRDLSEPISAGAEIGARVVHLAGQVESAFSTGIVVIELEG